MMILRGTNAPLDVIDARWRRARSMEPEPRRSQSKVTAAASGHNAAGGTRHAASGDVGAGSEACVFSFERIEFRNLH
jgi:hypothetical protein